MPIRPTQHHRGRHWDLHTNDAMFKSNTWTTDHIQITLLADIRDELHELNTHLRCPNFVAVPRDLRQINRRLATTRKLGPGRPRGKA